MSFIDIYELNIEIIFKCCCTFIQRTNNYKSFIQNLTCSFNQQGTSDFLLKDGQTDGRTNIHLEALVKNLVVLLFFSFLQKSQIGKISFPFSLSVWILQTLGIIQLTPTFKAFTFTFNLDTFTHMIYIDLKKKSHLHLQHMCVL